MSFINTANKEYPITLAQMREAYPLTIFPAPFEEDFEEYAFVQSSSQPEYSPLTQTVAEAAPKKVNGQWTQQWKVSALSPEKLAEQAATKEAANGQLVADKIEALWQAADRYTSGFISGVAIGILTIGVLQQKPKAVAVTAWSSAIWTEYYARKETITAAHDPSHDFSGFGPMPFTVPELQAEVGL